MVSVIIPVYNVEKYLKKCIESAISQTYRNIEIILVDDGSTDSSSLICDEYSKIDNRIRVIHKQNAGLGLARNSGMEIMDGEYVTFVDSDDYISDNLIENLINGMEEENFDICKSNLQVVDEQENIILTKPYNEEVFFNDEVYNKFVPRIIGSAPNKKDSLRMGVTGTLYKTSIIKENDILFPSERELISEDLIFNLKYIKYASKVKVISSMGYNNRFNPKSLTRSYRYDRFEACKKMFIEVEKILKSDLPKCNDEIFLRLSKMFFIYLKMCILQEKKKISKNNAPTIIRHLKKICNDELVQKIISNYPVKLLGFKQRKFIMLIKKKKVYILYILLNFL